MGLWEQLPLGYRRNGEQVLWEGAAAVMTAAVVGESFHEIDGAGVDRGFLILTDQQLIVGHRSKFRGKPEPWSKFNVEDLEINADHPKGVAFGVQSFGPIDVIICMPSRGLPELRRAAASLAENDERAVIERLAKADAHPVSDWEACPICEAPIGQRVMNAALCSGCGRCWANPGFSPVISEDASDYGALIGTEEWRPLLLAEAKYVGHTRAFQIRPRSYAVGPMSVPEHAVNDCIAEASSEFQAVGAGAPDVDAKKQRTIPPSFDPDWRSSGT